MTTGEVIYLDHNATTPVDRRVFEEMRPFFLDEFGNAASRQHGPGHRAAEAVEGARSRLASVIGADPREIVWTSGATEANNLAIKGVARSHAYASRRHVITVATEHMAVLDPCASLEEEGYELTRLSVDSEGALDLDRLAAAITDRTLLVSVMHANNETGVLHPIEEIGHLCAERGVLFHTDATQTVGREPVDVRAANIALLSCSAHKLCGPKGVGALYVRRRGPRVRCRALLDGGGHERGMRSGTLNVPGIVGFGAAAELCRRDAEGERERAGALRDRLEALLCQRLDGVVVNAGSTPRLANTTNLGFAGVDAESLMRRMPDVAVSSSAACTTAGQRPSHVLTAMGLPQERIDGSLRFSLGRSNDESEVDLAAERVVAAVEAERARPG